MASLTVGQRLDKLTTYLNQYIAAQKLPPQFLIKKLERSRDHVFRGIILERDFLFRTFGAAPGTFADGDAYPADWISYANNAYYTNNAKLATFTFVNIQEIGQANNNSMASGVAAYPKIFFSDQHIHTIPSGLSAISIEYIQKPPALLVSPIDLTITDSMPEDTEALIIREAWERTLGQLLNDPASLQLSGLKEDEVQRAAQQYYQDYYQKNIVAGGGVELAG